MLQCLKVLDWRISTDEEVSAYFSKPSERPKSSMLVVRSMLRPVDVYTYLVARFGEPNGFQNLLRKDDSDNWIHWDFNLKSGDTDVYLAGASREIHIFVTEDLSDDDWIDLIRAIKKDFGRVGAQKSAVLKTFEKYVVFQNKYVALAGVCANLHASILDAAPREKLLGGAAAAIEEPDAFREAAQRTSTRAHTLYANALQLRLITPIVAEAFINMVILMFCKDAVRDDEDAYQSLLRAKIPQRLEALSVNCAGFDRGIDTTTDAYKTFMRVIDKRNFALHGNVDPIREQIEVVYFEGKRPLFNEPGHNVEKFFDHLEAVSEPLNVVAEYEGMHDFLIEIRDCMDDRTRHFFDQVISDAYPGWEVHKRRVTRILPDTVITGSTAGMRYDDELDPNR